MSLSPVVSPGATLTAQRRRWVIVGACLVLLVLLAAWRRSGTEPPATMLSGPAISLSYGARTQQELAEMGVAWYTDFGFASPSVAGYERAYLVRPGVNRASLSRVAASHRGGWWSVGNEPNDLFQDNQTPAEYAVFFRDTARALRQADATAHIMCAGIADADWRWADAFRTEYRKLTGRFPQVDAWNIHNYILGDDQDPYDVGIFKQRIAAFRAWMNAIGEGDKPLILSEFGVLYGAGCCERPVDPPERGVAFMVETVTWLARGDLVQGWAWFMTKSGEMMFNGDLYDAEGQPTLFGQAYRELNTLYWLDHSR